MRSAVDLKIIRSESLQKAEKLGYRANSSLPLLGESVSLRSLEEVVDRSLAFFAVVACSYGFDRQSALRWMGQENVSSYLAESEREYLHSGEGDVSFYQSQVEGLNAFAWALGFVKAIPFDSVCDNTLIKLFPDIKNNGSSEGYRAKAKLRSVKKIISACDLAYCIHWAIREAELNNEMLLGDVSGHVIIERRRSLEWMLSTDDWDDISLDT